MALTWDVGLTTWGYKSLYANVFVFPGQYMTLIVRKSTPNSSFGQHERCMVQSEQKSAKMLLSVATVGQIHAVLCTKLSLSTAYPSKSNKSYKLVISLWTLYTSKCGFPTALLTFPWFYTVIEFGGAALGFQKCEWGQNQSWEFRSGFLTLRFSWVLCKNCTNQDSCLSL